MTWLNICQGLMLLAWLGRSADAFIVAFAGRKKSEPTGAVGVIFAIIFTVLGAVIYWRSGAVSTLIGGGHP